MIRIFIVIFLFTSILIFPQLLKPKVSLQQIEYDFGDITQNDVVDHSFTLFNTGGDLLKIIEVTSSCGCTAASPDKKELNPGESTTINVTFNSRGRKGPQTKTVKVKTNDPDTPLLTLTIRGNVIVKESTDSYAGAIIFLPESQHDFGKVNEGEILTYNFTFENKGKQPLIIKDITTSCGCTAAVVSSKNLEPGQSGSVKVDFDTKNRQGKTTRTVTLISNDNTDPYKVIKIIADISKN
jgi:uncharacterized cupredoxin-like copper-binding protein